MREIYSNSHVTIAADNTPKCTDGFLDIYGEEWKAITSDSIGLVREARKSTASWTNILSTRGWALQESILPNRILHFTFGGMKWQCNAYCRHENGQTDIDFMRLTFRALRVIKLGRTTPRLLTPPETIGTAFNDDEEEYTTHITDFLTTHTPKSVYYAWTSIMEHYSERELTKESDRLSAISGLASLIVEYMGLPFSAYLAGLWYDDLASGLLWYVKGPETPRRGQQYIAPSWSWASINGRIGYFRERYQFHFESRISVSEAKCMFSHYDPTGRVTSGQITLTGKMVPVNINVIQFPQGYKSEYTGGPGCASRTHVDQLVLVRPPFSERLYSYEVLCDEEMEMSQNRDHRNDACWMNGHCEQRSCACEATRTSIGRYYCLEVGVTEDIRTGGRRYWWLLLEKKTSDNEIYGRLGLGYYQVFQRSFYLFKTAQSRTITIV